VVAIVETRGMEKIIAEARYAFDKHSQSHEIAFLVDEEYRGKGIASFLFDYLVKIARNRGISEFIAFVLPRNEAMLKVFEKYSIKPARSFDDDAVVLRFNLAADPVKEVKPGRPESRSI